MPRRGSSPMSTKSWHISRRTMLRGVGVAMSLPLLDAMAPSAKAVGPFRPSRPVSKPLPVRMAVMYMPNGVNPHAWTPSSAGRDFDLSPTLAPLADLKSEVLVLSQLMNAASLPGDGHYVKTAGFLTGTTITKTTGKD